MKKITILAFLGFLMHACAENSENDTEPQKEAHIASKLHLLAFKGDKQLEIWKLDESDKPTLLTELPIFDINHWPIGVFDWELDQNNSVKLIYPNEFYQQKEKLLNRSLDLQKKELSLDQVLSDENQTSFYNILQEHKGGKLLVFPNKARNAPSFQPCINCPHWTPELYSILQLHLSNYSQSK